MISAGPSASSISWGYSPTPLATHLPSLPYLFNLFRGTCEALPEAYDTSFPETPPSLFTLPFRPVRQVFSPVGFRLCARLNVRGMSRMSGYERVLGFRF